MRSLTVALTVIVALAGPALAETPTPSVDQIIQQLRPGATGAVTRGIRSVQPSASAPSDAPPAAGPSAAAPTLNLTVQFATGSAELTMEAIHSLDRLGQALGSSALSSYRFRIEGHTDTVGAPDANKTLSEQRAAVVAAYLASRWHIDPGRMQTAGFGDSQPLVPTGPNVPNAQNRRVAVVNLGA